MTTFALLVAGASVAAFAAMHGGVAFTVGHGCALIVPLAVIAFPDALDIGFRRSWGGIAHAGAGPAPVTMIRAAGWVLLVIVVVVHHALAFAGVRWPVR